MLSRRSSRRRDLVPPRLLLIDHLMNIAADRRPYLRPRLGRDAENMPDRGGQPQRDGGRDKNCQRRGAACSQPDKGCGQRGNAQDGRDHLKSLQRPRLRRTATDKAEDEYRGDRSMRAGNQPQCRSIAERQIHGHDRARKQRRYRVFPCQSPAAGHPAALATSTSRQCSMTSRRTRPSWPRRSSARSPGSSASPPSTRRSRWPAGPSTVWSRISTSPTCAGRCR